ncbi:SNF2 family helicase [Geopyxis carbonaria]|nr:SNF2 family helicase [Geopyxis carbonaria]
MGPPTPPRRQPAVASSGSPAVASSGSPAVASSGSPAVASSGSPAGASSSSQAPPASQSVWTEADDERSAMQIVDLTQDGAAEEHNESLGQFSTKVVGIRYYDGFATMGEKLIVRREPENEYDSNAIRVLNTANIQVGHINKHLAAKLAPLMDAGTITVEALVSGPKLQFNMEVILEFWGPGVRTKKTEDQRRMEAAAREREKEMRQREKAAERARLEAEKARRQAMKVRMGQSGSPPNPSKHGNQNQEFEINEQGQFMGSQFPPSQEEQQQAAQEVRATYEELIGQSAEIDPKAIKSMVSKFGIGEENLVKLPGARQPARMGTVLLPYQQQGLAWLIQKEHPQIPKYSKDIVQLWKKLDRSDVYQNIATMFTTATPPAFASGGILADDMGLGKTIQIISLIASDVAEQRELVPKPIVNETLATAGTLIVAPLSVMSNWTGQMEQHVAADKKLKTFIYHGPARHSANLSDYDVVVTSYGTMTTEYNPKTAGGLTKTGLFSRVWRRIVLDEAHQIRNPKSKAALSATALQALSRWCLSGTPIVNSLKDLHSLLQFLRFPGGLADYAIFARLLIRPLTRGSPDASRLLQILMATLCLRRTKDMAFVDLRLPALQSYVHTLEFTPEERAQYTILEKEAKGLLVDYTKGAAGGGGGGGDTYRNLLELLLRMRQCCNHAALCGPRLAALRALAAQSHVDLNPENTALLQQLLQLAIDSQEDCAICLEPLGTHAPRITTCKHAFGLACLEKVVALQHRCPMCRAELKDLESSTVEPADQEPALPPDAGAPSSKITALLDILKATAQADPARKTVVFSQWTTFLTLLQPHLSHAGITFARIDGTLPPSHRDAALTTFAANPACTVLLASLGVAAVGLNLTAASQVVLTDPWWAPAIEAQAVDRVYRLGQRRETTVWRLVVRGSVEERVVEVQAGKRALAEGAFGEGRKRGGQGGARGQAGRLGDIQRLLA